MREGLWFLAMLFVDPASQADGIGQALMDRAQAGRDVDPGGPAVPAPDQPLDSGIHTWGMCTDAVQPISNALYARRGMAPRIPIWRLTGEVRRWSAVPVLPAGLSAVPFEAVDQGEPDGPRRLSAILDELDRELIGAAHPVDHAFQRREGRVGFLVRDRSGRTLGYVYSSSIGRLGPLAAVDPSLHPAMIGTAVRETPMLGIGRRLGPGHGLGGDAGPARRRPPHRRLPGRHLLVTGRPPVRALPPDLAGHRLNGLPAPARGVSLERTWLHRPCPWAETQPRPLRHRAKS